MTSEKNTPTGHLARAALLFVVLLGLVSLFADITYEGGRSLAGQYLKTLEASALAVGVAAGAGELLGYGLRLVSGHFADRTRRYWLFTMAGYGINLLAIPALALTRRWEMAVVLLFIERIGKAIRAPARDAMLSHATTEMGRGWGFGLHEAMDQIGAVSGPLIVARILYLRGGDIATADTYRFSFTRLLIPAAIALLILLVAYIRFPRPQELESKTPVIATKGFSSQYWWYLGAMCLIAFGFADFPLIAYHLKSTRLLGDQWIPVLYAAAMGGDAIAALIFGRLFDKWGLPVLGGAFVLAAFFAPPVFLGGLPLILTGVVLWGIGMGAQESIMRAAVAGMVAEEKRATAYGLFHTVFGVSWFLGSAVMGLLYDWGPVGVVVVSVVAQLLAVGVLIQVRRAPVGGEDL